MGNHFPYTHDEWLNQLDKWRHFHSVDGTPTRDVHVDPNQFTRYLSATGSAPDINSLTKFARDLTEGKAY